MKRFKVLQVCVAFMMLILSVFLFIGCNDSDEAALVTAQVDNVLPGTGTCSEAGPKVILSNPANNDEGIAIGTLITATFNAEMDPTTIAYTNQSDPQVVAFTLYDNDHPEVLIEGTVAMSAANTIATFTPSATLDGDSWYTVTISRYAKRLSDNTKLGCSYQWKFKTAVVN